MAANSYDFGVNLKINADTQLAKQQLASLQQQLTTISSMKVNFNGINALTNEISKASSAALTLQQNLQAALNPNTGNLNFSKFNAAIQSGGQTVDGLAQSLLAIGPQGNQAFVQLANSVARAEVPLLRTNAAVSGLWNNLKKTAGWQLSSSMIHGFIGGVQQAVGYAQALDKSLTNIRIVTGQSAEQMANFAREANIAAKRLSTTTTDYTNASLIYYQQGLSDAEVKKRTDVTLKMANVSGQTAEKVADQMTSVWNNFDNGTKSIEYYADVMTALGAATASSSSEIAKGIQKFAAISDTVGLSYEYAASALATITATTRESADTVGNSLKTLFSRIQGLQLGDTLDDGTNLNKYSSALAKVGISIKNVNGELKDMDVILDDMGSKWHTLAEDQKMALAQTVGGVRQYTQIMTLMENWDFFKSNLGIARGSVGTLQEQMDIFEDSWKGAQQRMRASWENLWDTLIDSEGFKELLNVGSTIVDNIAKAFQGLGGMGGPFSGGVLGLLTSSLGTIFSPQISHGVNSLLHNLGSLLPGARGRAEKQRMDIVNSMVNTIMDPGQTPYMTQGQREVTANNLKKLTQERLLYTQQQQYLTQEQQNAYSILDEQMSAIRTRQEETARLIDEQYAQRDRYAIGTRQYEDYYTRQFRISGTDYAQLNDLWKGMLNQVGLKGTDLEGKQLDSVYNLASDFGVRSARALKEITAMTEDLSRGFKLPTTQEAARGVTQGAEITADKLLFQSETGEVKVGGMAFDTMAKFWGISQDKHLLSSIQKNGFDFINEKNGFTSSQIALSNQLKANISQIGSTIDKTYTATASQQAAAVQKTMNEVIEAGKTEMSAAFGTQQGADQQNVSGIINSSQDLTLLSYLQKKDADNEAKIKEEQQKLLRQQQSFGAIATNAGLGISSAATALTSYESMIDNFKNGNTLGGMTGLGSLLLSTGMYRTGMGNALSGIGSSISSKASSFAEAQLAKEAGKHVGKYLVQGPGKYLKTSPNVLVTGSQALSKGASSFASNAGNIAMGALAGVFVYNELKKQFTKQMDTLQNESKIATAVSSQLQAAYQMSQNYQAAFVDSIQEYSNSIEKLTDLSLEGAEKAAAIFDQNSKAYQLINDYNIDEQYVSRVNDIVKIDERALAEKEEELIQKASVAKYAAEYSKYSANEAHRKYTEESLERSMGLDEEDAYNAAAVIGGAGAAALLIAAFASNPVGWVIGGLSLLAGGAGAGIMGYNTAKQRDSSLIDAILEESEKQGNTSWINKLKVGDTVGSYTIDQTSLEQIQQNQYRINQLYTDNKNDEIQLERSRENIARDILNNNDLTQDFKYSRNMEAGLINLQDDWYSEENLINYGDKSTTERVSAAKDVEEEMGLAGKNVVWTDDESHERLTYTYSDENGNEHTGELEYAALAELTATAKGKEEADTYISNLMGAYDRVNTSHGEDAAAGVLSFITGQNFNTATQAQIAAAKKVFEQIDFSKDEEGKTILTVRPVMRTDENGEEVQVAQLTDNVELARLLGLGYNLSIAEADAALAQYATDHGYATVNDLFAALDNVSNYQSETMQLMQERFIGQEVSGKYTGKTENGQEVKYDYSEWFNSENGRDIFGRMTESDMKKFYEQLNLISVVQGQEAGNLYLANLENILLNSGIDKSKIGEALSAVLSLDWNDWNINESLVEVLNSFGAELDILDPIIKNFTNNIRVLSHSIPNLTEELTNLTQIAGELENLKIGDSINESLMELLESKNLSLEKETFSTWNGENVLIGDTEKTLEGVRQEIQDTYDTFYNQYRAAVVSFGDDRVNKSNQITNMSESEFVEAFSGNPFTADRNDIMFPGIDTFTFNVLGREGYEDFNSARWWYQTKVQVRDDLYTTDENGNIITYWDPTAGEDGKGAFVKYDEQDAFTQQRVSGEYKQLLQEIAELQPIITNAYLSVKNAAYASNDPELRKKQAEQYVSTFPSFGEAMADNTVRAMMEDTGLTEDEMMLYYATKYPELTEYIEAYNYATQEGTEAQQEFARSQLLTNIALQDGLAAYSAATGKKADLAELQGIMAKIQADMIDTYEGNIGTDDLANMSSEAMVAADAYTTLSRNYSSWVSDIKAGLDPIKATGQELTKSKEALTKLGDALVDYLGLNDIKGITSATVAKVVEQFIKDGGDISKIIAGDRAETIKLKKNIILASNPALARRVLEYDSDGNKNAEYNETYAQAIEKLSEIASKEEYSDFTHTSEMSEEDRDTAISSWKDIRENAGSWEEYQAAMEAGGFHAAQSFNVDGKNYTGGVRYDESGNSLGFGYWEDGGTGQLSDDQLANIGASTGLNNYGGQLGRYSGGGGGGGPTKVSVKSASELMTRYKVIDAKMTTTEMQKNSEINKKDLLYGEAKIAQLHKINGLLLKQQQLTSDRIAEEMDYLEKDRERLREVFERHEVELEFDSEGLITNYKQTIGKMAEEVASFYLDGELTADEGSKAEEIQKKIEDLNTVLKDYEDSLNQLAESINSYEETLYELVANQAEELSYKVTYQVEINQDDLSYFEFYSSAVKDSLGRIFDFIELTSQKALELYDQIDIYNQGVVDLVDYVNENPLQLWAAEGIEGMLTEEQITNLRSYRDGLNSTYSILTGLRSEVEEKVLDVFDKWNEKIDKNVDSINRFSNMLSSFKDIINIIGKDVLGLSDTFMRTFDQQSINQSQNNIEATKKQYETLLEVYQEAQDKLAIAQASSNEESIEHWEDVVKKTQESMEKAQDSILTALNSTLNLIAEQFTNTVTEIIDKFNEDLYQFNGLDGLLSDYDQIKEQQDLMIADYEKIYNLNKLNRNLEKTINDSKNIAGKQKLLELQKEINDLTRNNVELSEYDLEYLQAKYDLRVAELELENARNTKDTVRLSKDSEGNWSYIYTQNDNIVEEAEQKYEDSLFKLQELSQDYMNEMSKSMIEITQQMRDEISELSIQNFASPEDYYKEVTRIQQKYAEQIAFRENELNKTITNSSDLYKQDWTQYNIATGYKISSAEQWADAFNETILGTLVDSDSAFSNYSDIISNLTDNMTYSLGQAAVTYFNNTDSALKTYGSSVQNFGNLIQKTTSLITSQSKQSTSEIYSMAQEMTEAFSQIADTVSEWQNTFGEEISQLLDEIGDKIKEINNIIKESNELGKLHESPTDLIGQEEASELLNASDFKNKTLFGSWSFDEESNVIRHSYTNTKGENKDNIEQNLVEFNGELVQLINDTLRKYANAKTGSQERETIGRELKDLIIDYKMFRKIIERIYDLTNIELEDPDIDSAEQLATGGYTGEWGNSGKLAVLHEKELVLSKNDTANFLDALNISRDVIHSMIEMNARQSSLALGGLSSDIPQNFTQTLEQQVSITAEFPNAVDRDEIQEAFSNLLNTASQYANRSSL